MLRLALWFLAVFVPVQMCSATCTATIHSPISPPNSPPSRAYGTAAMACRHRSSAWPDQKAERNLDEITIPRLGSLYLTHSWNGEVKGLKDFPTDQRPPVAMVYFAFRIMVGIAMLMLLAVAMGLLLWPEAASTRSVWYLRFCQLAASLGFIAVIAGWTTTEVGRQPWTIYGLFRTTRLGFAFADRPDVLTSLLLYVAVYLAIYPVGLFLMLKTRLERPDRPSDPDAPIGAGRPKAPIEALPGNVGRWSDMIHAFSLVPIWTVILALGVFFLCRPRRLRSRRRHSLQFRCPSRARPQSHHELDRPGVGRQRDLARARQRRSVRRVSPGFRHHHPGGLFSDPDHAAGLDLSRAGVRISLSGRRAPDVLGSRLRHRLRSGGVFARRCPRRVRSGLQCRGPAIRRQLVRLPHAIFGRLRLWPDGRLWVARRGLAGHQAEGRLSDGRASSAAVCLLPPRWRSSVVSLWTPLVDCAGRGAAGSPGPTSPISAPVPILTAALAWYEWRALDRGSDHAPFPRTSACSCCPISASRSACGR